MRPLDPAVLECLLALIDEGSFERAARRLSITQSAVSQRLRLIVDDQDFTHAWLREGRVPGCVSSLSEPLHGCRASPLSVMRYVATASQDFVARELGGRPDGVQVGNFARLPFVVFNRKDGLQARWVEQAFGVREPRLIERCVPSSEAFLQAVCMGWGIGMLPLVQARTALARGELVALQPQVGIDVALYWHRWHMGADKGADSPGSGAQVLDRIGAALAAGAPC